MTDVLLFHHALGLTPGVVAFADALRAAGHRVATPDLYDGRTFPTVEEGVDHARSLGFERIMDRGVGAADGLPENMVYAGFSLGVMSAQKLAQTRPGALGALLYHAALPAEEFGEWPAGVALQAHIMEHDPFDDLPIARELVAGVPGAELFVYPGSGHLFTDSSSTEYDAGATSLVLERSLELLGRWK
jgi:dienelactone hydrolase